LMAYSTSSVGISICRYWKSLSLSRASKNVS